MIDEESFGFLDVVLSLLVLFGVENYELFPVLVPASREHGAFLLQTRVQSLRGYVCGKFKKKALMQQYLKYNLL